MALCFVERGVITYGSFTLREWRFSTFCSCDLDLDQMTFIDVLDPPVLPAEDIPDVQIRTSYVKVFESYRLTDRQTDTTEITTPLRGWSVTSMTINTTGTRRRDVPASRRRTMTDACHVRRRRR